MIRVLRLSLPVVFLFVATMGRACLNDRDSIEYGFGGRGTMLVATGWFPQNPPEFYRMRIERLLSNSRSHALTPSEYDDVAVAYSRIGRDDEALKWIKDKDRLMKAGKFTAYKILPESAGAPEPWKQGEFAFVNDLTPQLDAKTYHAYSTQANWGTFLILRWIHAGMPANKIAEAREAEDRLNEAIDINPNAHAGREYVQVAVVDWLIRARKGEANALPELDVDSQTIKGALGLVELGAAWNVYDLFAYLTTIERDNGKVMAYLRAQELLATGVRPLTDIQVVKPSKDLLDKYEDDFKTLRKTAEEAKQERWKFMRSRFAQGRHPDIDPEFWLGYSVPDRPVLYLPIWARLLAYMVFGGGCIVLPVAVVGVWVAARLTRRFRRLS